MEILHKQMEVLRTVRQAKYLLQEYVFLGLNYNILLSISESILKQLHILNAPLLNINLSRDEIIKYASQFLKETNEAFYSKFIDMLVKDKIHVYNKADIKYFDSPDCALSEAKYIEFPMIKYKGPDYKVFMPLENNLNDVYSLIHEATHVCNFNIDEKPFAHCGYALGEVAPLFMEQLLTDYLINNKLFPEREIMICDLFSINNSLLASEGVYSMSLMKKISEKEDDVSAIVFVDQYQHKMFDMNINLWNEIGEEKILTIKGLDDAISYMLGLWFASNLKSMYDLNQDIVMERVLKFIDRIDRIPFGESLNILNFGEMPVTHPISLGTYPDKIKKYKFLLNENNKIT